MLATQLAGKYAKAIFALAVEENKLNEFGQQLAAINGVVASHADLAGFFNNYQIKAEAKKEVMRKIFEGELSKNVYNFLMLLIDKRRESLLAAIVSEYKKLANAAQNIVEAKVTVARMLSKEQEAQLMKKLETVLGKTVIMETKIDQSILGGVVVRIGDKLIDGSVVRQMQVLETQLLTN